MLDILNTSDIPNILDIFDIHDQCCKCKEVIRLENLGEGKSLPHLEHCSRLYNTYERALSAVGIRVE